VSLVCLRNKSLGKRLIFETYIFCGVVYHASAVTVMVTLQGDESDIKGKVLNHANVDCDNGHK
jgi:hypothetical protein